MFLNGIIKPWISFPPTKVKTAAGEVTEQLQRAVDCLDWSALIHWTSHPCGSPGRWGDER